MKNIYLSIIGALIITNLNAQITLTSATATPQIGDTFNYVLTPSPTFNVRQSGENQTWDFSSATGASSSINYVALSNSSEPTTFPLANIVEIASGAENYYSSSTSEYTIEGHFMTGIFRVIYTDKREFLKFPITYNDVFNETFSGTFENIGAGQIFDRGGTIEIKSDGYGDLILPYTTVNNVLRVRSVYNYNDSFMGTHVFSYSDTVYTWYNSTTNNFIASLSLAYLDGFLSLSQATYLEQSDLVNAIHDLQVVNKNMSFYPNPANNYITIRNTADIISIKIHDVKGILVKTIDIQNGNQQIDISDLNAGIYFIECYTKSYNYLEKLFVE